MQKFKVVQLATLLLITVSTAFAQGGTPQPTASPTPSNAAAQPAATPLQPVKPAEPKVVWRRHEKGPMSGLIWALTS